MATTVVAQMAVGTSTQRKRRKATASSRTMNMPTPTPKVAMSLRTKSIMSTAIIGTPPRWISAGPR
jgi:hypothetical protein